MGKSFHSVVFELIGAPKTNLFLQQGTKFSAGILELVSAAEIFLLQILAIRFLGVFHDLLC